MMRLRTLIVFSFFTFHIEAQSTLGNSNPYPILGLPPGVAIIVGVFGCLFLVLFIICAYLKCCRSGTHDHLSPRNNLHEFLRSRSRLSGIDRTVIDSIPIFRLSSLKGSKEGLECAVCLSEFDENEILRLLPKCKHAFHINCIDEWLESHSSCPLCRYKFDPTEFTSFTFTNSLRYNGNSSTRDLEEIPNLELFVQREEGEQGSSPRFNFGKKFQQLSKYRNKDISQKFHKLKHKIIVSDIFHKRRWSDLKSSDLMLLNSEMLITSSMRFDSNNVKQDRGLLLNEQIEKIKGDLEWKRILDSRKYKINHNRSISSSSICLPTFNNEGNESMSPRLMTSLEKKSMSEITVFTRFKDFGVRSNRTIGSSSFGVNSRDESIRRLWLPIVRRTLQQFGIRENNFEESERKMNASNV